MYHHSRCIELLKSRILVAALLPVIIADCGVVAAVENVHDENLKRDACKKVTCSSQTHRTFDDIPPALQDLNFLENWLNLIPSVECVDSNYRFQPGQLELFQENQEKISGVVEQVKGWLNREKAHQMGYDLNYQKIMEQYNHFITKSLELGSLPEDTVNLLMLIVPAIIFYSFIFDGVGIFKGVTCAVGLALAVTTFIHLSRYFMTQSAMHFLEKAIGQFQGMSSSRFDFSEFMRIPFENARCLVLQNAALMLNARELTDPDQRKALHTLYQKRFEVSSPWFEQLGSDFTEYELGKIFTQQPEAFFLTATMGSCIKQSSHKNTYTLLFNGNYYIAVTNGIVVTYMAFASSKDVQGFFGIMARLHNTDKVCFRGVGGAGG